MKLPNEQYKFMSSIREFFKNEAICNLKTDFFYLLDRDLYWTLFSGVKFELSRQMENRNDII